MIRALLKFGLLVIVVVAIGAYLLGFWTVGGVREPARTEATSTTGASGHVDVDKARRTGAEFGEKVAVAADRAEAVLDDTALTAKIKSKMALDDTVQARAIDVHTEKGVVTLSGTVSSAAERERAVQLARETKGVTSVNDHLVVR
jgi:hyperosmotically inducible protein